MREFRLLRGLRTPDDQLLVSAVRDLSGGQNTRQDASEIGRNQAQVLQNIDIGIPGKRKQRLGSVQIADDKGNNSVVGLFNYVIQGATDQLLMYETTNLRKWEGSGNWSDLKTNFSSSTDVGFVLCKESGLSPDDVVIIQNGVDNAFRLDSNGNLQDLGSTSGTGSDSPPKSTVMAWYGNRVWVLKDDLLYYSDAYPSDYSTAFDTATNAYRIPVGEERGIVPTRDAGMVVMGANAIWALAPSATPSANDKPEPLVTSHGVVSKRGWVNAGDDIYYFAQDGFRALKRTIQDKLQSGESFPISYVLKDEYDEIDWGNISKLSMVYFDNKILISVPSTGGAFKVWCYYPALNSFTVFTGWSPRSWAKYKVSGEERLYYGKEGDSVVYRALYGYTDEGTTKTNGTAIDMQEISRDEDLGQPLIEKNGGEIIIRALASGDYDVKVYAQFDRGGWNYLGKINLNQGFITFPVTFPVEFFPISIVEEKFHLSGYSDWRTIQIKLVMDTTHDDKEITILETSIVTFGNEYQSE